MNVDIRNYIINNFKGDNVNDLRAAIEESISENDEITLPGMGVFFEILWNNSDEGMRSSILNTLHSKIN